MKRPAAQILPILVWFVCGVTFVAAAFVQWFGDEWWFTTMLLFGPRWLLLLPVLLMFPFVLRSNPWLVIPLVVTSILVLTVIMGFNFPRSQKNVQLASNVLLLRVLTCNIRGGDFDRHSFERVLKDSAVDVIALQECPEGVQQYIPTGWSGFQQGSLAIFSRYSLYSSQKLQVKPPNSKWPAIYAMNVTVQSPAGEIVFCSLHLPSPRFGLQAVLDKNTIISVARSEQIKQQLAERTFAAREVAAYVASIGTRPTVVVGDFNTPVESFLYRNFWQKFTNVFIETGWGYGWTQRVSVAGIPIGVRIDHILVDNNFIPLSAAVGPDIGSDHLPLIADIACKR